MRPGKEWAAKLGLSSVVLSRASFGSHSSEDCGMDAGLDLGLSVVLVPMKAVRGGGVFCASGGFSRLYLTFFREAGSHHTSAPVLQA